LAQLAPQEFVGFPEREQEAARSLDLLIELCQKDCPDQVAEKNGAEKKDPEKKGTNPTPVVPMPNGLYDLRSVQDLVLVALYNPKLGVKATAVLSYLNSAECQKALVEAASRFTLPMPLRLAAAKAFRENTQRHGILLTNEEIRKQYRLYNESEKRDPETQHLLGRILDCLEVSVPAKAPPPEKK
jgi:hypothetical protein